MSNEKELERMKFRHLPKLKSFIPNFSWGMLANSSPDTERAIFDLSSQELTSSEKQLLSKK